MTYPGQSPVVAPVDGHGYTSRKERRALVELRLIRPRESRSQSVQYRAVWLRGVTVARVLLLRYL
jgi:hypothetical protein